jgi:hypothetical protein
MWAGCPGSPFWDLPVEPLLQGFRLPVWIAWAAPLAALSVSALLGFIVVFQRVRAGLQAVPPVPARPVQRTLQPNPIPSVDTPSKLRSAPSSGRTSLPSPSAAPSLGPVLASAGPRSRGRSSLFQRSERRLALRRGSDPFPVQLSDENAKAPSFTAHILDRSRTGLCIAVRQPIPTETILSVRSEAYADMAVWVKIRVRHCRQRDNQWLLGCSFVSEQPWSVLLMFG